MKINIKKIKNEMTRNGWNNKTLADKMDITPASLSYILTSKNYKWSNLRMIERFAKALNLNPRDLLL